MAKNAQKIQI